MPGQLVGWNASSGNAVLTAIFSIYVLLICDTSMDPETVLPIYAIPKNLQGSDSTITRFKT